MLLYLHSRGYTAVRNCYCYVCAEHSERMVHHAQFAMPARRLLEVSGGDAGEDLHLFTFLIFA